MKNEAILCNIGHFDSEISIAWLEDNPEVTKLKSNHKSTSIFYQTTDLLLFASVDLLI